MPIKSVTHVPGLCVTYVPSLYRSSRTVISFSRIVMQNAESQCYVHCRQFEITVRTESQMAEDCMEFRTLTAAQRTNFCRTLL